MNIVIYSYNFAPMADPESYCATRFASAFSRAGHDVTVVTMDWDVQMSQKSYDALVHEGLKIVRLPFSRHKNTPLKALLWYGHKSQMAVDVKSSVKAVKNVLRSLVKPILITRTMPIMSCMVGLKTYKYAYKWIAHFSDPIPWVGSYADTIGHKILKRLEINILTKTFKRADGISITCDYVSRYFKEHFGNAYDMNKVFKLTHIGDYRLSAPANPNKKDDAPRKILLHPGALYANRGGDIIVKIMRELKDEGFDCRFVQVGMVDNPIKDKVVNSDNIEVYDTISLEKTVSNASISSPKAIFVPDPESHLSYSPFLLSKFVYRIMENDPIVAYSYEESEAHDYAMEYSEAGIFWAKTGDTESLKGAIKKAMACDATQIDRTNIRKCFAEETIVENFNNFINRIYY